MIEWINLQNAGYQLFTRKNPNSENGYLFVLNRTNNVAPETEQYLQSIGFRPFDFGYAAPITYARANALLRLDGAQRVRVESESIGYIDSVETVKGNSYDSGNKGNLRRDGKEAHDGVSAENVSSHERRGDSGGLSDDIRRESEREDSAVDESNADRQPDTRDEGLSGEGSPIQQGEDDSAASSSERVGVSDSREGELTEKNFNPRHFFVPDDLYDRSGFAPRERAYENLEAIKLIKELAQGSRDATEEEKIVLSKYNGWGGLYQIFNPRRYWHQNGYKWLEGAAQELEETLTEDEYNQARNSIDSAFFTPSSVVKQCWESLTESGFQGGKILEPSVGIGNFFGFAPQEIVSNSQFLGVEKDHLSANIAKQLYPDADIRCAGYENVRLPNNFFDLAISNVPYGNYKIFDSDYVKSNLSVHDYFIVKSLDKIKPGGLAVFVTSRHTMDKKSSNARQMMANKADLAGAVRLPNNTFSSYAGTDVITDILFFVGRDKPLDVNEELPDWVNSSETKIVDGRSTEDISINNYFRANEDQVVGEFALRYGYGYGYGNLQLEVRPPEENHSAELEKAIHTCTQSITSILKTYDVDNTHNEIPEEKFNEEYITENVSFEGHIEGSYVLGEDDKVYQIISRADSVASLCDFKGKKLERIKGLISLRDKLYTVIQEQKKSADETVSYLEARENLNNEYDKFVEQHGYVNLPANRRIFLDDPGFGYIMALEHFDEKQQTAKKADIFHSKVINPAKEITSVDSVYDGLLVILDRKGEVDIDAIANLCGKTKEIVQQELLDSQLIFKDPEQNRWVPGFDYLSGHIREKLEIAKQAAYFDPIYKQNVQALENSKPEDLKPSDIDVKLGVPWVETDDIKHFIAHVLNISPNLVDVDYRNTDGEWVINAPKINNHRSTREYGTSRKPFLDLVKLALSQKAVKVYDTYEEDGKKVNVLNYQETIAAEEKLELIQEEFRKFIWETDEERTERLLNTYNYYYNSYVPPKYDGSHLTFPGMSTIFEPRDYQKDAVWRILNGNTLLAHEVGLGKTFVQVAGAIESKRLGKAYKPLIIIPNHMLEQIDRESRQIYPSANILCVTKKDFEAKNRRKFIGKVANNNWDLIIMTHSMFEKVQNNPDFEHGQIQNSLIDYQAELEAANQKNNRINQKEIEKKIKNLEFKLASLSTGKKDDGIYLDDLGVDMLFVDEAHKYKNLSVISSSSEITSAISGSKRAWDLYLKTKWIYEQRGNEYGVHFATGTPVSNNPFEIYNMQRYLQPSILEKLLINHANTWSANFLEPKSTWEPNHAGTGWKRRNRYALKNVPELMQVFRTTMDMLSAKDVGIKRPEPVKENIVSPMTETQEMLMADLDRQINEKVHVFSVMHQGKILALDPRIFNESEYEDESGTKINKAVEKIHEKWEESQAEKGTQLVFCDLSVPNKPGFNVYDDMRNKLMEKGMPKDEIAFIHEYNSDNKKAQLFEKVRNGDVRVLIGSTNKMGEGMNVQDRLVALHHIDAPWTPAAVEQRNGRIIRFGNDRDSVDIFTYTTEDSFDLFLWNLLKLKNEQFSKILSGNSNIRSFSFEVDPTYAETAAITSGNPKIKEKLDLEHEIVRLENLAKHHSDSIYNTRKKLALLQGQLKDKKEVLDIYNRIPSPEGDPTIWDIDLTKYGYESNFTGSREQMLPILRKLMSSQQLTRVDNIKCGGLPVSVTRSYDFEKKEFVTNWTLETEPFVQRSNSKNIEKLFTHKNTKIEELKNNIEQTDNEINKMNTFLEQPFERQKELQELLAKRKQLDKEISEMQDAKHEGAHLN